MTPKAKQSLLVGALAGSFGIFISKALGLFYVIPLNQLAGEGNMAFYSITYSYYDLLLKICGAGIPFAIAAMVAKYYSREDYKTVLLVRKIGTSFILVSSFVIAVLFFLVSQPLSSATLGAQASAKDVETLYNLFKILLIAVIFVPLLSAIRGYYQGLKRMDLYASSQVIEQIIRVSGIIGCGYLFVKIMQMESVWAIYVAIFAAGCAAILTLVYMFAMTRKEDIEVKTLAAKQTTDAKTSKELFWELITLGIPYVIISFLGTSSSIVNSNFFISHATASGMAYDDARLVLGILQVNCNKIAAIPQVLTLGFSAGLVPYLTESLEKQDYQMLRRQIGDILDTVFFFLIPVVLAFMVFAKAFYYIMYGGANLELGSEVFWLSNFQTITDTIAPILSSMMITLRHRKNAIIILTLSFAIKFITFFPLVSLYGYAGMIFSSVICSLTVIIYVLYFLYYNYAFRLNYSLRKLLLIVVASFLCLLPSMIVMRFLPMNYESRLICVAMLAIHGIVAGGLYLGITYYCHLPQTIFHVEGKDLLKVAKRFRS